METVLQQEELISELVTLCDDRGKLHNRLQAAVREADFYATRETQWAYLKLATFLEDGWTASQQHVRLKEGCPVTLDQLGCIINRVASGTRYDLSCEQRGIPWVGAGSWPTCADMAAYVYFLVHDEPL